MFKEVPVNYANYCSVDFDTRKEYNNILNGDLHCIIHSMVLSNRAKVLGALMCSDFEIFHCAVGQDRVSVVEYFSTIMNCTERTIYNILDELCKHFFFIEDKYNYGFYIQKEIY